MKRLIGSKSGLAISIVILTAIVSISNSCSKPADSMYNAPAGNPSGTGDKGGTTGTPTNEVLIQGMAFTPSTITVTAGTTVTWINNDYMGHTVTSDSGLFDSGEISSSGAYSGGGSYTHTFPTAGTFPYHCSIHTTMTGTVIVN